MMNARLCVAALLTVFIVKSVNCDFNESNLEAKRKEKNVFVFFVKDMSKPERWYSHGHFGEINHFYSQVKDLYDKNASSSIVFEKVDCKDSAKFCENQNITKLMELKYFAKDSTDNKKMFDFIHDRINEAIEMHLAEDAAKAKLKEGRSFVEFHSPNCTACQGMANEWSQLENAYEKNDKIKIFKIDCKATRMVCKKFKILNYPTMIYFESGKLNETYSKGWNFKEFSAFIDEKLKFVEPEKNETVNHVVHITPENFNQTIAKGITFVKFNLHGCSHCIVLDPAWKEAAAMVSKIDGVQLAEIECKDCYGFCLSQKARGFPTMNVYKDGEMVKYDYYEVSTAQGFYDCAMAYKIGGEHLENWIKVQKELKSARHAARKAAAAAGNTTVEEAHH